MRNVFIAILATASSALTWYGHPNMVTDARTPGATIMPSSAASSLAFAVSATTAAPASLVTRAPSVGPSTLRTIMRPHKDPRHNTRVYSNAEYTFISEYDGKMITVKPCISATTLVYHGTHPLTLLEGSRCPGCDRVLDPNDQGRYNGRYDEHHGHWHPHDEDLGDPNLTNHC